MQECLCRHFYSPTYNREILTRTDHMNLLATPRGYRWYGPGGELRLKQRAFQLRAARRREKDKEKEKANVEPEAFPGMAQFLSQIWDLLTPDLLLSLKEILMEEFNMGPTKAVLFLIKQYTKAQRLAEMEVCNNCPTEEQLEWAKYIAGTLASKMTQYTEMMATTKRSKRTMLLYRNILERLQKVFGVQPDADTPLNKVLLRVVDGLAVWLSSLPGENALENICSDLMTMYTNASNPSCS